MDLRAANNSGRLWGADFGRGMDQTGLGKGGERERKMLIEGIDDPAAEGGDRWWDSGEMSPARERRREKEERAE